MRASKACLALLISCQVGSPQQGVDGGAGHPGQRSGGENGDVAARLPQAALLQPPRLELALHGLPLAWHAAR